MLSIEVNAEIDNTITPRIAVFSQLSIFVLGIIAKKERHCVLGSRFASKRNFVALSDKAIS